MVASGIWEEVITWAPRLSHWISGLRCRWSCKLVCFERPSQTGDCRRRRSWSRWTPERWHSWNFWCLRWDWDLRFLLLHFFRSHAPVFLAQIQIETPRHLKLLVWTYHFADYNFHPTVCRNEFWSEQPWSFHQLHLMSQDSELFWVKAPFRTMFAASVLLCSSMSIFFHLIPLFLCVPDALDGWFHVLYLESEDMRFPNC